MIKQASDHHHYHLKSDPIKFNIHPKEQVVICIKQRLLDRTRQNKTNTGCALNQKQLIIIVMTINIGISTS